MIYEPAEDSELLASHLVEYVKGKSFLDMGAGSGIQSERAQALGAKSILSVDITKESVDYVKRKGFDSVRSNLFASVKGKFDVIAFNPPYLPLDTREDASSRRVTTGGKKGDEITLRFIKSLPLHLKKGGVGLIVVSSLTPPDRMEKAVNTAGLVKRVIGRVSFFMEKLELWELKIKEQ